MRVLAPGASTTLSERWEVRDVPPGDTMGLRDALARPIDDPASKVA
jgi:hypothetical protein